jgi:nucleoside phosphorylase
VLLAPGGHGKTQLAVQAQYLIDRFPSARLVVCAGAARAAVFNDLGALELRAVTDAADKEAPQDFGANLPVAMENLARVLIALLDEAEPGRGMREADSPRTVPAPAQNATLRR